MRAEKENSDFVFGYAHKLERVVEWSTDGQTVDSGISGSGLPWQKRVC
jgi:hypothetical protein